MNETERQLRALLRNSSDMITVVGPDATILHQTGAVGAVVGCEPAELEGHNLTEWVDPEDVPSLLELCQTVESGAGELRLRHSDGSARICEVRATGLVDESAWWGAVLHIQDVTRRKQLELDLRLAQKLESVGQLAAGIAHEINTPLQYISSSVHFVSDSFTDISELLAAIDSHLRDACDRGEIDAALIERVRELADTADLEYLLERVPAALTRSEDGLKRVAELVGAMRTFAHPPTTVMGPVDINEAIRTTLIVAANEYKDLAEVVCQLGEISPINGNAGDLNQVLLNLIVNAAHAIADVDGVSEQLGTIQIQTRDENDDVIITIADTGCGIPAAIAERVFDPFFTTKDVGAGTGQGLAIARTIIERHDGTIRFDSEPGQGTTFTIRLPIAAEPLDAATLADAA